MNAINVSHIINAKPENNSSKAILKPNDIINMTVTSRDNTTTTLTSSKFSFSVASEDVIGNVGDDVSFEVVSSNTSKLELKQINTSHQDVARSKISQKSSQEILEMFKNNNVLHETDIFSGDEEELRNKKAQEVIRKIQGQLKYATNNTSDSAVRELLANGINLNKITLNILTSVMNEIDARPIKEVTPEEIANITNSYLEENNISSDFFEEKASIIKELKNCGLPATKDNIQIIENILDKVSHIKNSSDYTKFLKDGQEPTIENLYALSFSGVVDNPEINNQYQEAEELYKDLAKDLNLDYSKETEKLFKSFIANDIDITEKNINSYNEVKDKITNLDKETLIKELIEKIKLGEKLLDTNLLDVTVKENVNREEMLTKNIDTIDTLNKITNENINFFIRNYKVLNIYDLKTVVKDNQTLQTNGETKEALEKKKSVLQLMEKLTYDVAYKLAKSGVDIDTHTVTSALEEINKVELASYTKALNQYDIVNNANTEIMVKTFDNISKMPPFNSNVYYEIMNEEIGFNINEVTKSVEKARAINGYEIFETEVSGKWKDSFSKVSEQISPFLEKLGLPTTDKNLRSAEILIKNHMDITLENIESIKTIDLKIDKLQETLHPRIVAKLLADGQNPLTMDIDQVLEVIDEFNDFYGNDVKEKIANYLLEAEKSKDISAETLQAMKSIYKALNIIQKNNGASIGSLYNANHSLTIGNLLDSSKYYSDTKNNKSKINTTIGDEYIETIENPNSIKNVVEKSLADTYEKLLLEKFTTEATPQGLSSFIEHNDNYKNQLIENAIDILNDINKEIDSDTINDYTVSIAMEKLENALSNKVVNVNFLVENNIPLTMENLFNFKDIIDNPFEISKKLKKAIDNDISLKGKFKELSEDDLKTYETQGNLIDVAVGEIEDYEPTNYDLITNKTSMLSQLDLYSAITKSHNNNFSQIPIKLPLSDEVTTLNMYVVNENFESKEEQKIGFSLDTEFLGNISAMATFQNNSISITISGNSAATRFLENSEEELVQLFGELGYKDIQIDFNNKDLQSLITNDFV